MGAHTSDGETGLTVSGVHVEEIGNVRNPAELTISDGNPEDTANSPGLGFGTGRVIESERQRQAALSWIAYWKASIAAGEQSWLAGEQALGEIMQLRTRVNEYEKRTAPNVVQPITTAEEV